MLMLTSNLSPIVPPKHSTQVSGQHLARIVEMDKQRLARIEQHIFELFREKGSTRLLTKEIFEDTGEFSHADVVRAFEDLEKRCRMVVRYTKEGSDWVTLTANGADYTGMEPVSDSDALPHPPRSII